VSRQGTDNIQLVWLADGWWLVVDADLLEKVPL
jgi:hypothetical protein